MPQNSKYRDEAKRAVVEAAKKQGVYQTTLSDRQTHAKVKTFLPTTIDQAVDTTTTVLTRDGTRELISSPITDGDVAESGERDESNHNTNPQWWIRINGRWVNTLGGCEDDTDAATQPVFGTEPKSGSAPCLAKIDHVHGIPTDFTQSDGTAWPEGTIVYHNKVGWVRTDDLFVGITHLMVPVWIDTETGRLATP